jgi:hypothetical protein
MKLLFLASVNFLLRKTLKTGLPHSTAKQLSEASTTDNIKDIKFQQTARRKTNCL